MWKEIGTRLSDFGRGLGAGLSLGLPVLITLVAFVSQEVFAFTYMREIGLAATWAIALALLVQWKSVKLGQSGVEIHFAGGSVPPGAAVPQQQKGSNP